MASACVFVCECASAQEIIFRVHVSIWVGVNKHDLRYVLFILRAVFYLVRVKKKKHGFVFWISQASKFDVAGGFSVTGNCPHGFRNYLITSPVLKKWDLTADVCCFLVGQGCCKYGGFFLFFFKFLILHHVAFSCQLLSLNCILCFRSSKIKMHDFTF